MPSVTGSLRKMLTSYEAETQDVYYTLNLDGEGVLPLNPLVGEELQVEFTGEIHCVACSRLIKKTFGGGYCYPCFQSLPECDQCIVRPELCHFHEGTCRDAEWGLGHCFQKHTLYLARSSSIKIGITRSVQQIHRWMDQGAVEAKEIGFFENRLKVGLAEAQISKHMADKTNWRKMLKNEVTTDSFEKHLEKVHEVLSEEQKTSLVEEGTTYQFSYPVQQYPEKVTSRGLEKLPSFTSQLLGIKGQYLIFDSHVINIRSHSGYGISMSY